MTKPVTDPFTLDFVQSTQDTSPRVEPWDTGALKWFDERRRIGFIIPDEGDEDIFFPWTVLKSCGIPEREAQTGIRVRFKWKPAPGPGRRPEATQIVIIRTKR
jgi:cold shock CspA family protein